MVPLPPPWAAVYIGDGTNRWAAVHRLDSARLFRLALENAPAGSTLHVVADEGVPIRDIAEVIGRHFELPMVSMSPEDADEHFAWLGGFLGAVAWLGCLRLIWRATARTAPRARSQAPAARSCSCSPPRYAPRLRSSPSRMDYSLASPVW